MIWNVYYWASKRNRQKARRHPVFLGRVRGAHQPEAIERAWNKYADFPKRQITVQLKTRDPFFRDSKRGPVQIVTVDESKIWRLECEE